MLWKDTDGREKQERLRETDACRVSVSRNEGTVHCRRTDASKLCRTGGLTREQGQKILLIDKITLKKAAYPTKLLIFVINNIVIGKIKEYIIKFDFRRISYTFREISNHYML